MTEHLISLLVDKTKLQSQYIQNILTLLNEGCTIPFIARYRKELTGGATDEQLREFEQQYHYFQNFLSRKEEIISLLKERGFYNDKLHEQLNNVNTLQALEDIYAPFKQKKSSRTSKAIENGLEGLANQIHCLKYSVEEIQHKAKGYVKKEVKTMQEAIDGACDIIAQRYADDFKSKEIIRNIIHNHGLIKTTPTKTFEDNGLYAHYKAVNEKVKFLKAHRFLAINRAVNEKQLTVKLDIDETHILDNIKKYKIPSHANSSKSLVFEAYKDGLKRLLLPTLKREVYNTLKEKASADAIKLFGKNLKELLQTPPLVNHVILGMDPGYKTGCKLAVINENGDYLDSNVIYPTKPKEDIKSSTQTILALIKKHHINAIAIGNGTASQETASFIAQLIQDNNLNIKYAVVSEIGASVYSASKIAMEEYPHLDVTIRGAISIAARLRDPMATLVKIEPKSLGIGQYQHDVNQKELTLKLENTTVDLVNFVGVDINSASYKLLSFISGISEKLAKNIIEYKQSIGAFKSKNELLNVKGLGAKAYEQCVGFLRIKEGKSLLDNTGIHPENYPLVKQLQTQFDIHSINIQEAAHTLNTSVHTLQDIIKELLKPGFDVREEFESISFNNVIKSIDELKEEDMVQGIVRNITDFGAFVDIGLKNDALLHISQIANRRISHPSEVLSINEKLKVRVIRIERDKNRVGVSLK